MKMQKLTVLNFYKCWNSPAELDLIKTILAK